MCNTTRLTSAQLANNNKTASQDPLASSFCTTKFAAEEMQVKVSYNGSVTCTLKVHEASTVGELKSAVMKAAGLERGVEAERREATTLLFREQALGDHDERPASSIGIDNNSTLFLDAPLGIPEPVRCCSANAFNYIRVSRGYATLGCRKCDRKMRMRDVCMRFWRCTVKHEAGECPKGDACPNLHIHMKDKKNKAVQGPVAQEEQPSVADVEKQCPGASSTLSGNSSGAKSGVSPRRARALSWSVLSSSSFGGPLLPIPSAEDDQDTSTVGYFSSAASNTSEEQTDASSLSSEPVPLLKTRFRHDPYSFTSSTEIRY